MKPSIGRIVHYEQPDLVRGVARTRAAVITEVYDDAVHLTVIDGYGGTYHESLVRYSEEPASGCWSWPPRVEEAGARPAENLVRAAVMLAEDHPEQEITRYLFSHRGQEMVVMAFRSKRAGMVSAEGAHAAWGAYSRQLIPEIDLR